MWRKLLEFDEIEADCSQVNRVIISLGRGLSEGLRAGTGYCKKLRKISRKKIKSFDDFQEFWKTLSGKRAMRQNLIL